MPDQLSNNDHEEELRMENELLRLKLMAELGGQSQSFGGIDPKIENQFLKQVLAFEQDYANIKRIKVYDRLGSPDFSRISELNERSIEQALQDVNDLLSKNNIAVDFICEYDNRTKYHFITEELFEHEMDDLTLAGMTTHFTYEEFHPNHKHDIENRAMEFLSNWYKQDFGEYCWEISGAFVLPDKTVLTKNDVLKRFQNIFDAYTAFTDEECAINEISFQLQEYSGMGHAEGFAKYTAILENGERVEFAGPFKLYMELDTGWWSIFYAVFPGLKY